MKGNIISSMIYFTYHTQKFSKGEIKPSGNKYGVIIIVTKIYYTTQNGLKLLPPTVIALSQCIQKNDRRVLLRNECSVTLSRNG